jgi:flagellar motor switch protein FliM
VSQLLTQDEINALIKGVADGSIPAGAGSAASGAVRTLDLTSQERSLRGRLPGLERVLDRFVRQLRVSLGAFFGQLPTVAPAALELVKLASVVERLPSPVSLQLFRLTPLRGAGLLVLPPSLVGPLLQVFFGGSASRKTAIPAREFSTIEQRVLERVGARVLHDFASAWTPVQPLDCTLVRTETDPRFVQIVGAQDLVVMIEVRVEIEGCEEASLTILVPNGTLDPVRPKLLGTGTVDAEATDNAWGARLRDAVVAAEIEVSAELGSARLPLRTVLALGVGDLVTLGTGRDGPVLVRIAGRPRYLASPGVSGASNAVRVIGVV